VIVESPDARSIRCINITILDQFEFGGPVTAGF